MLTNLELAFVLLYAGLVTWRISYMLVSELGPWDWFMKLRERAGVKEQLQPDPDKPGLAIVVALPQRDQPGFMAKLLVCMKCTSWWVAAGVMVWLYGWDYFDQLQFGMVMLAPFALSGLAVFFERWL